MLQIFAFTLLALSPLPQQAGGTGNLTPQHPAYPQQNGPPVFSQAELQIEYYTPAHIGTYELQEIVGGMVGRTFYLSERGGYSGDSIDNMSIVGEAILLYDTPEYLERMRETFAAVDRPVESEKRAVDDPWLTFHYTPRYLSMADLYSLAESLTNNISVAGERRILVVHDRTSVIQEIETLLAKVDVPEDQILVTAYLVRGWDPVVRAEAPGDGGPPLPADLASHLGALVPGIEFEVAGFAMLQSAAVPRSDLDLKLRLTGSGPTEDYYLSFAPTAYDRQTGSLSVESCELAQNTNAGPRVVFSTNTVFGGAKYTVLGATGAKPIFVVVRLAQV
jgi:hypothetical protein